jgi:hypothetical protein
MRGRQRGRLQLVPAVDELMGFACSFDYSHLPRIQIYLGVGSEMHLHLDAIDKRRKQPSLSSPPSRANLFTVFPGKYMVTVGWSRRLRLTSHQVDCHSISSHSDHTCL